MNKLFKIICVGLLLTVSIVYATRDIKNSQIKKVLISQVIDHPALNKTTQGIIEGLEASGYTRGANLEVRIESAQGNPAVAAQIASKFVAQKPDVVIGVGTVAAQSFIKYAEAGRVKLVFSTVTDPRAASLENYSGVSNFVSLEPQLQLFKRLQPNLNTLGIIYNPGEINSVSIVKKIEQACATMQIKLVKQTVTKTIEVSQAAVKLSGAVDAIFISNDNTVLSSLQCVIKATQQHNIPVYVSDTDSVTYGALAALGPNQREVGRQTGRMVAKILQGSDLHTIEFPEKTQLFVNLEAADSANIKIPATILAQVDSVIKLSQL